MERVIKLYNFWCKIDDKIRFVFIGCLNAAISYIIYAIALFVFGDSHYQLCVALQWVLSSVPSYLNQKFFVFCTHGNYIKEYLKCCSNWFVSYFVNAIILELFIKFVFKNADKVQFIVFDFAIKNSHIAQFISLILVSVITYVLFKHFAFKQK